MGRLDTENLLLNSNSAKKLFYDYAEGMPIFDYHNHLNPKDIAINRQFDNLTELWLEGITTSGGRCAGLASTKS